MATKKGAQKTGAKKAAPKKAAAKKPPAKTPAKKAPPAKPLPPPKAAAPSTSTPKGKSIPPGPGAPKDRVLFPKDLYEANKDAIKAPLKAHGFAWQFLGEGKGRYHRDHVAIFVEFKDEGTDYHIRYTDEKIVSDLLAQWKKILGADAFAAAKREAVEAEKAEAAVAESEAVKLWRIGEPQPRDGEPESFFKRRRDEWLARKPS